MDMDSELDMVDEVEPIIKQAIDAILRDMVYNASKVTDWANSIIAHIFKKTDAIGKPFKYLGKFSPSLTLSRKLSNDTVRSSAYT